MSCPHPELSIPPTDGSVLLHDTLAFHRTHNPTVPMYLFAEDGVQDITTVTYGQFDKACQRVARSVGNDFHMSTRPVVAVLALADTLLYQAVIFGMMSVGFIPFPISPRNSAAAIAHLLRSTSCHHVFTTGHTLKELVSNVQEEIRQTCHEYDLSVREIPGLFEIFPEFSDDPTRRDLDEVTVSVSPLCTQDHKLGSDDVAVYLHSSGSTGLPKPIPRTHRNILEYILSPCCMVLTNRSKRVRMAGMLLPPFHAMGIVVELFLPLFSCVSIVLFPPVVKSQEMIPMLATAENTLDHIKRTNCNALVAIPMTLQTWAKDTEAINALRGLDLVMYGGGPLSQTLGDCLIENGIKLQSVYGGTEAGGPAYSSLREGDEREWDYVEFSDNCDIRWIPQGDGTYECHLYNTPSYHLSIHNLPNKGLATSDLFTKHATKPYLWKFAGRLDDIILHSSGEKTTPLPLEGIIMSTPHITGCVIFGKGHNQPGVLVEPSLDHEIDITDAKQVSQFRSLIWPTISEANKIAPTYSKIFKESILIADRRKPLPRAPKGTVIRKLALGAYMEEIEALYRNIESPQVSGSLGVDEWEHEDEQCIKQWILNQIHELCPGKLINTSDNVFEQGLDSLSATILHRRISNTLEIINSKASAPEEGHRRAPASVAQNAIYLHPTIDALAHHIIGRLRDPEASGTSTVDVHIETMEALIRKYEFLPASSTLSDPSKPYPLSSAHVGKIVFLTGSTGYLGSQVLDGLCRNPDICKIYTLNRPSLQSSIIERHQQRFTDTGLDIKILESPKIVYLETEYSQARLGLSNELYYELSSCIDVIIHAAWRLDFNLELSSFESHIRGMYNLIELARHRDNVKFIFTSSVSAAQSWDQSLGPYPEDLVYKSKYAVGIGYGESKYVAEMILANSGLNFTSLRIGQITGNLHGAWAISDWVPILVKSCLHMGYLPSANGNVSWLPMDTVTNCVLDLVSLDGCLPKVLNLVHPRAAKWDSVMDYIKEALLPIHSTPLHSVPFNRWVELLEKECFAQKPDDLQRIPAIKLVEFFKQLSYRDATTSQSVKEVFGTASFSTRQMVCISKALAGVHTLEQEDANLWVKYWNSKHFFD